MEVFQIRLQFLAILSETNSFFTLASYMDRITSNNNKVAHCLIKIALQSVASLTETKSTLTHGFNHKEQNMAYQVACFYLIFQHTVKAALTLLPFTQNNGICSLLLLLAVLTSSILKNTVKIKVGCISV